MSGELANNGARLIVRNLAAVQRELDAYDSKRRPVSEIACRVELYRLMRLLQGDLRQGKVAGRNLRPLRVMSRGTRPSKKPLSGLAQAVRYSVVKAVDKTMMAVGFAGPAGKQTNRPLSKSWRRIAHRVQEGAVIDPEMQVFGRRLRELMAMVGGQYKKGRGKNIAKYYFLRKSTRTTGMFLPKRPIIEPFWRAHETTSRKRIILNFDRKMKGERI